jgi:hypothetical protein
MLAILAATPILLCADDPTIRRWHVSAAALAMSQAADLASSTHACEINPLLRNPKTCRTEMGRAIAIKSATSAGTLLAQHAMIRIPRFRRAALKVFPAVNFAASGVTFGVAVRNFHLRQK